MSLPLSELPLICVSAREYIRATAMLQALSPLALVPVPVLPHLDPVPLGLAVPPLPYVAVALACRPHTMPVLEAHLPLAIVDLPMRPLVDALAMRLAQLEGAAVRIAGRVHLEATAFTQVPQEVTLILPTVGIAHDTEAMPQGSTLVRSSCGHLTDINRRQFVSFPGIVESDVHRREVKQSVQLELRRLNN
jgi:hypothetical protein